MLGSLDRPIWLFVLVLTVAIVPVGAAVGTADPQPPEAYYGSVEINDHPAPTGVEIVARIDGDLRGSITVDESGTYGGPGAFEEKLTVNGSGGAKVRFFVAGLDTEITDELNPGDVTHLNLSVTDADPPNVEAGANVTIAPGESVQFDASGSTDNSEIWRYEWEFGDGSTATGVSASHTYDSAGTYEVVLTVTDVGRNTAQDTLTVTVESQSEDDGGGGDSGGDSGGGGGGAGGGSGGASTPTSSPTPTASPTPTSTPTPTASPTPTPTKTPTPSPTPTSTETAEPTTESTSTTDRSDTRNTPGETATNTPEPTLIPVETSTEIPAPATETPGQPGFGPLAMVLAVLATTEVVRRRRG